MRYGVNQIKGDTSGKGLGKAGIHTGGNSGYQAVNLVYLLGARKIILLGFDMKITDGKMHWHGNHPAPLNRGCPVTSWIQRFQALARDLRDEGVEVINATRDTALNCFKTANLEECL